MELAIDTSTSLAGIAISDKGKFMAALTWQSEQNHTLELVPNIDRLLKENNATMDMITAIFVAIGPGSFNGLRVGISTAKGFALALNSTLTGISTLEIEAYPFAESKFQVCPIHNAGRGEIATAFYKKNRIWECLHQEYITTLDNLVQKIKSKTIFCGEIGDEIILQLQKKIPDLAIIPDAATRMRKPRYLAELGWLRLYQDQVDELLTLQPIYLREPPITQRKIKFVKK